MARSTYIYVAQTRLTNQVVVCCTVKHEFLRNVKEAIDAKHIAPDCLKLLRIPDNGLYGNGADITDQFEFDSSKQ